MGGFPVFFIVNVFVLMQRVCLFGTNFYINAWAYDTPANQQSRENFYTLVILGFSLAAAIFVFLRCITLVMGTLRGSKKQHDQMINKVMHAPINLFFDVTPIGKILNRFSRDLSLFDDEIGYEFGFFFSSIYGILISLAVAALAVPYILVVEALFICFILYLFKKVLPAYKECFRINLI
jgi:ABC-type multidrug transport system fused ATPase/permease subunit